MKCIIADYFSQLKSDLSDHVDISLMGLECKVTALMNATLDKAPSSDEIKETLFQMHPTKAHGLDGFHALFF